MSVILAVYSENAFKEFLLPNINNADYSLALKSDFFQLSQSILIDLEVMDNCWYVKKTDQFHLLINNKSYKKQPLANGDVLKVSSLLRESLSMIVKEIDMVFHGFEKYSLQGVKGLTIGKDPSNDICYSYLQLVSRKHAEVQKKKSGYKIVNLSKNGTYVNSRKIEKEYELKYGDYINIMGLHMVYLGDILAIDTKSEEVKIQNSKLAKVQLKIEEQNSTNEMITHSGKIIYHRAPRNIEQIKEEVINLEEPPQINREKTQSLFMSVGPSVTMTIPMLLGSMMMIYSSQNSGGMSSLSMYSGLIMAVASAALAVGWAVANMRYQKNEESEQEKLRFDAYSQYLIDKTEEIKKKYENAVSILDKMYPEAEKCIENNLNKGFLWNRNLEHDDFLKHRLGIGNIPFPSKINIPQKKFSLITDELSNKPQTIKENYDVLYDVPVTLDLENHNLIGIVGGKSKTRAIEIAKLLSASIAVNNCYTDVKMGFIFNKDDGDEEEHWSFAKWLPHVWSEDKKTRYVASEKEEASDVFYELTKIFRTRIEEEKGALSET